MKFFHDITSARSGACGHPAGFSRGAEASMRSPRNGFLCSLLVLLFLVLNVSSASAQGLLVNESSLAVQLPRPIIIWPPHPMPPKPRPEPVSGYAIKSLEISANVNGQIAEVNVSQTFTNTGSRPMEVSFVFPLPYEGAIDSMVLLVDGKEYPAQLLAADEARKTYQDIVRRNQDPALLEWIGTGMFKTNVFPVPAGASRTVQLKYSQLLRVDGGLTDFLFPMSTAKYTAKPVEKVEISLNIEAPDDIKNVYSPSHEIKIRRPAPNKATVLYSAQNTVPGSDFRLMFDSGKGEVSTRLLSFRSDKTDSGQDSANDPGQDDDGYFMLLASPKIELEKADLEKKGGNAPTAVAKTVIFVVDESSSMSGNKIEQARDALKFVLNNLREGDLFNIVRYSSGVSKYKDENQEFNETNRNEAIAYADSIRASGMTNIDAALKTSLDLVKDRNQPTYVIFLTDGCPTAGVTNEMQLAEIARKANSYGARLFAFGVGFDVNARLLDRLARDNKGQTEYVKPNENIEERVGRLYNRISSPILTDVAFEFKPKGSELPDYGINRVYPSGIFDLFAGEQLVLVGRYSKPGDVEILVRGKVGEDSKEYRFEGKFVEKSADQSLAFVPRLWAMRRIGEILDQLDLETGPDKTKGREELIRELVGLSTKYGILTPYTSFLADENTQLTDFRGNTAAATSNVSNLAQTSGRSGFAQRSSKQMFKGAMQASGSLGLRAANQDAELAMQSVPARATGGFNSGNIRRYAAVPPRSVPAETGGMSGMGESVIAQKERGVVPNREANVQTVNNRAFFQKGGVWIDSTLTEEQQKTENVVVVKQFSEDYFKLIEQFGKELTPYLALGGTQLVNLDGKAYRFEEK